MLKISSACRHLPLSRGEFIPYPLIKEVAVKRQRNIDLTAYPVNSANGREGANKDTLTPCPLSRKRARGKPCVL
jgi:hypothetical protein